MRVLVTGADGYIGAVLGPYLLEHGIDAVGLDTGFYRDGWLYNRRGGRVPPCITRDIREVEKGDLEGCDAVVHLAELSNDPLGQRNPEITYEINHLGSVRLAELSRSLGIRRFVYTSSCSVYGVGTGDDVKTEASEPNPQTAYARCKVLVERDVGGLAGDDFSPIFLRNATAYGASPRIRFDLVLNNLSGLAWTTHEIKMVSDGTPWRPLVHVRDICEAIRCALVAPREAVHGQVFNVGASTENYQVRDIAAIVASVFPGCTVSLGRNDTDNRSYRVSFDKIAGGLPGFRCHHRAEDGARELFELFTRIGLTRELFDFRAYTRLKQLDYLSETRQIDADCFWTWPGL